MSSRANLSPPKKVKASQREVVSCLEMSTAMTMTPPIFSPLVPNFTFLSELGRGSFAVVYLASNSTYPPSHVLHLAAIKVVSKDKLNKKLLANLEGEISIMKRLRHDHIVGLLSMETGASTLGKVNVPLFPLSETCDSRVLLKLVNSPWYP